MNWNLHGRVEGRGYDKSAVSCNYFLGTEWCFGNFANSVIENLHIECSGNFF